MGRPLTQTQKDTVSAMLKARVTQNVIAKEAKCSTRQVKRIKANIMRYGTQTAPKLVVQGRPHIATQNVIDVCSNSPP